MQSWLPALIVAAASVAHAAEDATARIRRVESGLLPPVVVEGDPAWTLAERMSHYRVPGLQVAVIEDFHVAWEKAYGVADAASGRPATSDTLFQAASISKSHTAAVALKLVEQGRLQLDAPINGSLTTWKVPDNEFTREKPVTLAGLLSHTAGTTAPGFPGYVPGDPLPTITQVLDGAPPANTTPIRVDTVPGKSFRYSGGGTTIVQLAIQDVTGRPFAAFMKSALLDPLGLTHGTFEQPLPAARLADAAVGHGDAGRPIAGQRHVYPELAAAGLWTTAGDLARFGIAIQESLAGRPGAYLKPETAKRMATVVTPPAGLGFFVDAFGWKGYVAHAGGNEGFTCLLLLHRDKGYGAAVVTNAENGPDLIRELLRAVAREYGWEGADLDLHTAVAVPAERLASFAGRYVLGTDSAVTIAVKGSRLVMREPLRADVELVPTGPDTFVRADRRVRYRFADGRLTEGEGEGERSASKATVADRIPSELIAAGETQAARDAYRRLLKARADDPDLAQPRLYERGVDLLWRGETAPALALLEINAELHPASALAQAALAEHYAARGDTVAAARAYRRGLSLLPADPDSAGVRVWAQYVWDKRALAMEAAPGGRR